MKTITILSLVLFASLLPLKAICQDKGTKQATPVRVNKDTTTVAPRSFIREAGTCHYYIHPMEYQIYVAHTDVPLTEIARYGNHLDREDIKYSIYK